MDSKVVYSSTRDSLADDGGSLLTTINPVIERSDDSCWSPSPKRSKPDINLLSADRCSKLGIFQCSECGRFYRQEKTLQQHLLSAHKLGPSKQTPDARRSTPKLKFKCSWSGCPSTFATKSEVDRHEKQHDLKPFTCYVLSCQSSFADEVQLLNHIKSHFDGSLNSDTASDVIKKHVVARNGDILKKKQVEEQIIVKQVPVAKKKFYESKLDGSKLIIKKLKDDCGVDFVDKSVQAGEINGTNITAIEIEMQDNHTQTTETGINLAKKFESSPDKKGDSSILKQLQMSMQKNLKNGASQKSPSPCKMMTLNDYRLRRLSTERLDETSSSLAGTTKLIKERLEYDNLAKDLLNSKRSPETVKLGDGTCMSETNKLTTNDKTVGLGKLQKSKFKLLAAKSLTQKWVDSLKNDTTKKVDLFKCNYPSCGMSVAKHLYENHMLVFHNKVKLPKTTSLLAKTPDKKEETSESSQTFPVCQDSLDSTVKKTIVVVDLLDDDDDDLPCDGSEQKNQHENDCVVDALQNGYQEHNNDQGDNHDNSEQTKIEESPNNNEFSIEMTLDMSSDLSNDNLVIDFNASPLVNGASSPHSLNCSPVKNIKCGNCDQSFANRKQFLTHHSIHHPTAPKRMVTPKRR